MDILELLDLFFHESLKLYSDLLSNVNIVSMSNIMIMKKVDILHSLSLEISIQFLAPLI